jgi:hypothetical protein
MFVWVSTYFAPGKRLLGGLAHLGTTLGYDVQREWALPTISSANESRQWCDLAWFGPGADSAPSLWPRH